MTRILVLVQYTALLLTLLSVPSSAYAQERFSVEELSIGPTTKLVVIGEMHETPSMQFQLLKLLERISKTDGSFDCFFSEFDRSKADIIEAYQAGSASYDDTIGNHVVTNKHHFNLLPEIVASAVTKARLRIVPVDYIEATETGFYSPPRATVSRDVFNLRVLEARNDLMVNSINAAFQSGQCHRGVFLVGGNHLERAAHFAAGGTKLTPVQDFAKALGLETQAYTMHMSAGEVHFQRAN